MNDNLKNILNNIKKAQEEKSQRENISHELDEVCKKLDDFTPKIVDADTNGVDLSALDKDDLEKLTKRYDTLLRELIKMEGFESPWNFKSH